MLSGFLVLFIHAVCMFIGLPDVLRHFLRLQAGKTVFISVPDRLFIIPALEAQHVQNPIHPLNLRLHRRFLMEEQFPPLWITPCSELQSNQPKTRNASRPGPVKNHRFGTGSVFDHINDHRQRRNTRKTQVQRDLKSK